MTNSGARPDPERGAVPGRPPRAAREVIAGIDPARLQANVLQAEAELAVAKANVAMQRASLSELEADAEGAGAALAEAREERKRKHALPAR